MIKASRWNVIGFICLLTTAVVLYGVKFTDVIQNEMYIPTVRYPTNGSERAATLEALNSTPALDKITHIGFLKVHKSGSTTLQNMFFRFALRHNLTLAIPKSGNYFYKKESLMPIKAGGYYDIIAIHTVYKSSVFKSILPKDAVNIAVVREPFERMVSAAYYYRDVFGVGYLKNVPKLNFIHNIVKNPEKYDPRQFSKTRNAMAYDFGITSPNKMEQDLDRLNKEFRLVMVVERFEESLVLLKRYLRWSFRDIAFLKANSHDHKPVVLDKDEETLFRKYCGMDVKVYEYFTKEFEKRVKQEGPNFHQEVDYFKDILDQIVEFCKTNETVLTISQSQWDGPIHLSDIDCKHMQTKEIKFISQLRERHRKMHADL